MINVVVISGAGLSVDSGIKTYRGATGIYTDLMQKYGRSAEELVTPRVLKNEPELFWAYWAEKIEMLSQGKPCQAHTALVEIAQKTNFLEITQNVDGLSRVAGLEDDQLVEIHGSANGYRCMNCGIHHGLWVKPGMSPPKCYRCRKEGGAPIRPNVIMFGESIEMENYTRACQAARAANLVIVVGTSFQFHYLLEFVHLAYVNMARIVLIDPNAKALTDIAGDTPEGNGYGYFDIALPTTASKGLALLNGCIDAGYDDVEKVLVALRGRWREGL